MLEPACSRGDLQGRGGAQSSKGVRTRHPPFFRAPVQARRRSLRNSGELAFTPVRLYIFKPTHPPLVLNVLCVEEMFIFFVTGESQSSNRPRFRQPYNSLVCKLCLPQADSASKSVVCVAARPLLPEITAATRAKGQETAIFVDNLDSQTTQSFMKLLRQNHAKRHLGVSNATDICQLVDNRVGRSLKVRIGVLQDEWMAMDSNDELWAGAFPMWKKRVLMTQWAGKAWDGLCKTFQ